MELKDVKMLRIRKGVARDWTGEADKGIVRADVGDLPTGLCLPKADQFSPLGPSA